MYCLVPEKPLRLVYRTFYLAICDTFCETVLIDGVVESTIYCVAAVFYAADF